MKSSTAKVLGIATIGGVLAAIFSSRDRRERLAATMEERMEKAIERMPDDSPPKLVKNVMPRLAEQNEEMLGLLREQNELLKQRERVPG